MRSHRLALKKPDGKGSAPHPLFESHPALPGVPSSNSAAHLSAAAKHTRLPLQTPVPPAPHPASADRFGRKSVFPVSMLFLSSFPSFYPIPQNAKKSHANVQLSEKSIKFLCVDQSALRRRAGGHIPVTHTFPFPSSNTTAAAPAKLDAANKPEEIVQLRK